MKKFFIGVIVGAALATAGTAFANNSYNAIAEDFKILVNGKEVTLEKTPITIDGSSYLPVRTISDALGYKVQYETETRTISLSNDGKSYVKDESTVEGTQTSNGSYVKDLESKYTVDGKMSADKIKADIASGALSVNAQDADTGDSLFILAIKENNFSVYQVLKDNKVDPILANKEGKTPLHIAVIEKSDFYLGELINYYRVKTKVKDNSGKTPLDYTEKYSDEYMLLSGRD